jgi:transcriptional regulator with XRE-family HTH domain
MINTGDRAVSPDPVLVRLADWARRRGLSREDVARRLGVTRPAVAGWFLGLEALERDEPLPRSARSFQFTSQKLDVQRSIAEVLALPLLQLRAESLSGQGALGIEDLGGGLVGSPALPGSEVRDLVEVLIGQIAVGGLNQECGSPSHGTLRHRAAEVVEAIDEVVATLVVAEPRGSDQHQPYQHQLVVFVAPCPPGTEEKMYRAALRRRIDRALAEEGLACYWEHGVKEPRATLPLRDKEAIRLGSLVCPFVAASRSPRTGLLVRPYNLKTAPQVLRIAAVVTNPYGGSDPIAGHLAHSLGAGHLRSEDLTRAVFDAQVRRSGGTDHYRGALFTQEASSDAGLFLHQALHALQMGTLPGAWLLSTEVSALADYAPLQEALAQLTGVLVTVHLGPEWLRMAAWRLAAATLNLEAQRAESHTPASSDGLVIKPDVTPNGDDLAVLQKHLAASDEWQTQLQVWEQVLDDVEQRRRLTNRPTMRLTLESLPDDGQCIRFDEGTYRAVTGAERFTGAVVFRDLVDGPMDAWIAAAVDIIERLIDLAGYPRTEFEQIVKHLGPGPVTTVLKSRWTTAVSAR